MQCSRSAVATATCRGGRWLSAAGGPPLFTGGLGAAPFSTDASDGDTPEARPGPGRGRGASTIDQRFIPHNDSGVSKPQRNIHPATLARRQAALGSKDPGVPHGGRGRGRGGDGATREQANAQSARRGRILSDSNAFAALQSGESQRGRGPRSSSNERRPQRGDGRQRSPRGGRRPGGRSPMPSQPQFPQFEEMPTFAEAHFEKELLTQIYAEKDKTLHFQLGMPKPWEDVRVPNAEERWDELDDYLEGMKDELLAPLKEDQEAERFAKLEEGKGSQKLGEGAAGEVTGESQAAVKTEATVEGDKAGDGSMLRPGAQAELIKPVDMELEETWKYLKEHTLMQVVSQEHDDMRKQLRKGESWMGGKQQDRMLASLVEEAEVDDEKVRAALEKYQAVVERNSHWKFMDRYNVMKKATSFVQNAPRQ